jgi:fused signal recognition particle receptor
MQEWLASDPRVWVAVVALVAFALALVFLEWRRSRRRAHGDRDAAPAATASVSAAERFRAGLAKSRDALAGRLADALGRGAPDALLEGMEEALLESDVGIASTQRLLGTVRTLPAAERTPEGVRAALRCEVAALLGERSISDVPPMRPWVVLVVGVNGVGKTTTIGKLAARHRAAGRTVLMVAADTFRAAAIEQLGVWAERSGSEIVKQVQGADPSSVVFDGMQAAVARDVDVVLIDTAGRLHTKANLMEELKKVRRVIERAVPGAPHEVLLVVDATTGQNAVSQARTFAAAVEVSGVVLTKLDGTARGGVVIAIRHELGLPIRYVGLGEKIDDLALFDAEEFAAALVPSAEAHRG